MIKLNEAFSGEGNAEPDLSTVLAHDWAKSHPDAKPDPKVSTLSIARSTRIFRRVIGGALEVVNVGKCQELPNTNAVRFGV